MRGHAQAMGRFILCWLLLAAMVLPVSAQQVRRDVDYRVIPQPQPVEPGARIEVIEFFFYPCPYCNELAVHLDRWLKRKPADVLFRRMPVIRHDSWVPLAKIYFTLEAMDEVGRLHLAVYHSYHVDDLAMSQEKVIAGWAAKNGLDSEKFMSIYRSDPVRQKVELARKMTRDYDIQGTPSVVVDGRYLTSSSMTPGVAQVIPVIDGLVRLSHQQRLENNTR